jgi:hypothetical protein
VIYISIYSGYSRIRMNSRRAEIHKSLVFLEENGAPGTIRTSDPQIRSLMLYPAELRARIAFRRGGGNSPFDCGAQAPFERAAEKICRPGVDRKALVARIEASARIPAGQTRSARDSLAGLLSMVASSWAARPPQSILTEPLACAALP